MPITNQNIPSYKPKAGVKIEWNSFKDGYNALFRPTELKDTELAQADNIMLVGSGAPTGRWGTSPYFTAGATGTIIGLGAYATGASISEVLTVTDSGYVTKKNGMSFTQINGQSYPSGTNVRMTQLGGYTYLVSRDVPFTQYNGNILQVFATVSPPTLISATNISGISGTATYSWKVVTLSQDGNQTNPSNNITLGNLPNDLATTTVRVTWTQPSTASITGFEIYRGTSGDETLLANLGNVSSYIDVGDPASESVLAPLVNQTGGVKSEIIAKIGDRLLIVPADDPSKLMISGRYPDQSKFSWAYGGGYIYIDPNSGSAITSVAPQLGSDKIIVTKEYSVYAVTLDMVNIGNYNILDPKYQPISTLTGCSNQDTMTTVENDQFYFGRKGLYVVGYEPNYLNLIRTNEISARIRPYLAGLSAQDYKTAAAFYVDNKYVLSFPRRKECIVYDRERGCWLGIWKLPFGISKLLKIVDSSGTERWIIGSAESNQVYTFEPSVYSDNGTTITKTVRTKKEFFDTWASLKTINFLYFLFRNVTGQMTVNVLLEDRNGAISTVKTFTISGSAIAGNTGWGIDTYGTKQWGESGGEVVVSTNEIKKWVTLFKQGTIIQFEITTTSANSNFELLGIRATAQIGGEGQLAASQRA